MSSPSATTRWRRLRGAVLVAVSQVGWLACVLGAAAGHFWLGPVVVAILLVAHLAVSEDRLHELELIVVLGLIGTALDSLQACLGLLTFRGAPAPCVAPPWIAALWFHFGTVRGALFTWLRGRLAWAALFGAVAGPLAYGAGARFGAASFHPDIWPSVLSLAVQWGVVLPLAVLFTWRQRSPENTLETSRG